MAERIYVFDTTLRDGEQVPGCQLNTIEKIEIAKALEDMQVDVIEAGFPISSPGDFNSIIEVSKVISEPTICALTRAIREDIDCAAESLRFAKHKRIHTGIGASDIHIREKFKSTRDKVLEQGVEAVKYAKKLVEEIEFYAEDAGRADNEFLAQLIEAVIKAGATVVNIPDTTGYCTPEEYGNKIKFLKENVRNIDKAIISTHSHNDLGLATATTLAGIMNGARQVEVTMNGVGERAGNTSLEEVVMVLKTRKDYGYSTNIDISQIIRTSRMVSRLMRMPVQANKAIVGRNAFAHSSGIHQDGVIKKRLNYEIIDPKDIGLKSEIVLTARSGRAALTFRLKKLGYEINKEDIEEVYKNFIAIADKKREVTNEDLYLIMGEKINKSEIEYVNSQIVSGTLTPTASLTLSINGEAKTECAIGDGPIDASYKCINNIVKKKIKLQEYLVQAITGGSDDLGKVHVQIEYKKSQYYGFAADTDIIVASIKAYINAINKIY